MKRSSLLQMTLLLFLAACQVQEENQDLLALALASEDPAIRAVMDDPGPYEVQIRYTRIDRRNDSIIFTDHDFQVNDQQYFYPASTVKFPIAVLALERLHQTDTLNHNTRYYVEGDTLESTVAKDVLEIFAVSDNLANNRLVELLGQDAINQGLANKGVGPVRISHRLGQHSDDLRTKPWIVYLNDSTTSPTQPTVNTAPKPLEMEGVLKGRGYMEDDGLQEGAFNFSLKNHYPIATQHEVLKRVIFPEQFPQEQRFQLSEAQRKLLLDAMRILPRNAGYDANTYYDAYCKFFMFGDSKAPMPEQVEIYNKVGFAYGTLTDCAYIKDKENKVDFLLTATILVNANGIFNDNQYEYDTVGIPFLAALGREIHALEVARAKS
ncbi:serine hydrolase [Maribacter sp. 2307ULW6-5]|uniref:serine hydrolase n=1 Tax=Maribacter sp. 2307ULW6-5 TaxID=3386275 RepID=UPI0039BD1FD8